MGDGGAQGLGRVLPGPGDAAHDQHRVARDLARWTLRRDQRHHPSAVPSEVHASQGQQSQVEPTLPGVREEELVRCGQGAQGGDGLVVGAALPGRLQQARGVEVHAHRRTQPRHRGGFLGLHAQDAIRAHALGVLAELAGVGEHGRATVDRVLVPGHVQHLVARGPQGFAVMPRSGGAAAGRTVIPGQPAVEDDEDSHPSQATLAG